MIALPVLGVTAADLTYRSALPTKAEELTAELGSADARFTATSMGPVKLQQLPDGISWNPPEGVADPTPEEQARPVDVTAAFPEGSRHVTERSVPVSVTTRHGITDTEITELRIADPMLRGRIELTDGSFPRAADEIAATEKFIESSGLSVGDRVTVRGPDQTYTLTGTVELPADLRADSSTRSPARSSPPGRRPPTATRPFCRPRRPT